MLLGTFTPVALGLNFQNVCMMNQPVYCGNGHRGVGKDLVPVTKGMIGGNQQAQPLVTVGYQLKQDAGLRFRTLDVANIVYYQQAIASLRETEKLFIPI